MGGVVDWRHMLHLCDMQEVKIVWFEAALQVCRHFG